MINSRKNLRFLMMTPIFLLLQFSLLAQQDTVPRKSFEEYLKSRKGFLGKVIKGISKDTTEVQMANDITRNVAPYKIYEGYVIRHITIDDLPFGTSLADTSKKVETGLTRLANKVHHTTRSSTIRNNLFFTENELLLPYLVADNETFLRQLPYIQDVRIRLTRVPGSLDSVDVNIRIKDLFSLGGSLASLGLRNTDIEVNEANLSGTGNGVSIHGLYDNSRRKQFGAGLEYIQRNIGGSFISADVGYQSYYPNINGLKEENLYYLRLAKPLINRYMKWTYEFDFAYHSTRNMYSPDTIYYADIRYRYSIYDAWVGYNINSTGSTAKEDYRIRKLVALRIIDQKFYDLPTKFLDVYSWRYANVKGVLGSLTFYRQNFYKSQFIYAFGRNEDIPEGLNLSVTAGYTQKQHISRPLIGVNTAWSFFSKKNNYFNYSFRAEGYLHNPNLEDVNILAGLDYFDHLKAIGKKWKQRTFINLGFAKQINTLLNEPLYLDSKFGLHEFRNGDAGGSLRATIKAESVFFSPWHLASFRFAPFVFGNTGLFTPYNSPTSNSNIYTTVGGGLRTRNESLVFGTLEFRGYYFLKKNFYNKNYRFDISTNIIFKYNSQLVKRPDFIEVN